MSSINNIVKRLRESRLNEEAKQYMYKFDVPWRETVTNEYDEMYHYRFGQMDYAEEIIGAAKEDFNNVDWNEFASDDRRTKDCGILSMKMDFDESGDCIVTVMTSVLLDEDQIQAVMSYLEGQMSDGWGEGFEQREVASFREESEEWVEDYEDEESGGYYDTVSLEYTVSGQFWWHDSTHPWEISLIYTPADEGMPTRESVDESATERMEFSNDSEAYEWAEENGYKVDKIQNGQGGQACICWMSKIND